MLGLARALFRPGREQRLSPSDWAEMFSYAGNTYPINFGSSTSYSNTEEISNDFVGYTNSCYKANGVVFACIQARSLVFSQARFMYQSLNKGKPGDLFSTPDLGALETPWPNASSSELIARALQDADLGGNSYTLRKSFKPGGRLRRLRPDWTDILLSAPPDEALESDVVAYIFKPGGTQDPNKWEVFPVDGSNGTVAHWSPIPDPDAQYRGMSWITPVLTDIRADIATDKHKAKFFENGAQPGLAVSLKDSVDPDQFEEFVRIFKREHEGVGSAYRTLFLGGGADVHVVGTSLQQMNFKDSQGHLETRIASAARIHPSILGLAENIHGSELNGGNWQAAKDLLHEGFLSPMWASLCTSWGQLVAPQQGARLWYDSSDIPFLDEDRQKNAEIGSQQASTIASLIQTGYTPKSVQTAVLAGNDWSLLEHTGLFSVQLLPPNVDGAGANVPNQEQKPAADPPAAPKTPAKQDGQAPVDAEPTTPPAKPSAPTGKGK